MMMKNEHRYKKYWSCDEKVYGGGGGDDEMMWKKYWDCEVWVAQCQRG